MGDAIQITDMLNARPSHHGYFMVINMLATEGGKNPIIRPIVESNIPLHAG